MRARTLALAAAVGLAFWAAPSSASAQEEDDLHTLRVVLTVGVSLADVGFIAGDVYYGSEGEWLPFYAAWTELVLMGGGNLAMAIWNLDYQPEGGWLAVGVSHLVLGVWFMVHGTLSLLGQPDEPPPPEDEAQTAWSIAPLPEGGAVGSFGLRF